MFRKIVFQTAARGVKPKFGTLPSGPPNQYFYFLVAVQNLDSIMCVTKK